LRIVAPAGHPSRRLAAARVRLIHRALQFDCKSNATTVEGAETPTLAAVSDEGTLGSHPGNAPLGWNARASSVVGLAA
jgi:hypothetical protein